MKLIMTCLVLMLAACSTTHTYSPDKTGTSSGNPLQSQKQLLVGKWACQAKKDGIEFRYITYLKKGNTYYSRLIAEIVNPELGDEGIRVGAEDQGSWLLNTKGNLEMTTNGNYEVLPLDKTLVSIMMAKLIKASMQEEFEQIGNTSISEIMKLDEVSLITNDITKIDEQQDGLISYCQRDSEA